MGMAEREVLAAAIGYALQGAALVTSACLDRPTPCARWDLRTLLTHLAASMAAIEEALATGHLDVGAIPSRDQDGCAFGDPVELLRDRAASLLVTTFFSDLRRTDIAGVAVPAEVIRAAAALETAVHGWDIYAACGQCRPVPASIAGPLLATLALLIPAREGLFASPVPAPPGACPGDRLIAELGREWTPMLPDSRVRLLVSNISP